MDDGCKSCKKCRGKRIIQKKKLRPRVEKDDNPKKLCAYCRRAAVTKKQRQVKKGGNNDELIQLALSKLEEEHKDVSGKFHWAKAIHRSTRYMVQQITEGIDSDSDSDSDDDINDMAEKTANIAISPTQNAMDTSG